jgi:hypothetical protein
MLAKGGVHGRFSIGPGREPVAAGAELIKPSAKAHRHKLAALRIRVAGGEGLRLRLESL